MKLEGRYLKFVRRSDEDRDYIGYCPDLFPWGGVCHGLDEEKTYRQLGQLIREEVEELTAAGKDLPAPVTRPMREVLSA